MKLNRLISLACFLNVFLVFSQNRKADYGVNTNSYISISPLSIADPFAPRFRFGYVQHIQEHFKLGLDIGLGVGGRDGSRLGETYTLWEIRPEFRYILKPAAKTLKYLSVELFYIDQSNELVDGDYEVDGGGDISYDRADFDRQKYGMHFKFGLFLNIGKHLGFDFYGGIGFRFRNSAYSNVVNPVEDDIFREWFATLYDSEGKNFGPNSSLGFRFYYRL